jgi:hypothetical protein
VVAGRGPQILIGRRIVDHLDFAKQPAFQIGWDFLGSDVLDKEIAQPVIAKAHDHSATPPWVYVPLCGTNGKTDSALT